MEGFAAQKNSAIAKASGEWIVWSWYAVGGVEPAAQSFLQQFLARPAVERPGGVLLSPPQLFSRPLDPAWRILSRQEIAFVSPRKGTL